MTTTARVHVLESVHALADNPFPRLWVEALQRAGAVVHGVSLGDLRRHRGGWLHLQWPEWYLADERGAAVGLARLLAHVTFARVSGTRVLLTVHNLRGHDSTTPRTERVMWTALSALVTHVHTFTRAGYREFTDTYPLAGRARPVLIPHGDYGPVIDPPAGDDTDHLAPDLAQALARTGRPLLLSFGKLKAYKGVAQLLDLLGESAPSPGPAGPHLLLAGQVADEATRTALVAAAQHETVDVVPRFLTQRELVITIAAADLVVLPYRRVTNSGSALLALSVGRPVLLPRTPVFEELRERAGADWVHLYDGDVGRVDVEQALSATPTSGRPDLSWCSWDVVTTGLRELLLGAGDRRLDLDRSGVGAHRA